VSIALSKVLLEANWAKRILFLADRISLVNQAQRNYTKFLPNHTNVNLLKDKENDGTRIVFSTYQTLMGLIDSARDGDERFYGVGHFDLIIFDEAHRSIYQKYQAIFEYFDALFLGLTATPKNSIDRNTYSLFGLPDKTPTDAYTFEEAVDNHHLVGYRTIEVPTKFQTKGIKYKDLSPEEQEEFEKEILDGGEASGDEWVDKNALNAWLFNKDTAIKTLNYILKHGIKKRAGEEIGKTIIFARNRKHAEFLKDTLLELDKERFSNDYAKVITYNEPKAEEFINRFCDEEKERLPQIAISVDMLDTGIDAPSVVNLVFYKPVKSYTKFWQMIGRGSRLRPDLFGPGMHKNKFLIFDLCGNFEFFEENPEGIEAGVQKSLTEVIFNLKLHLAELLKEDEFQENEELQEYRIQLLDGLYGEIANLDKSRFDVKMKLKSVMKYGSDNRELWNHLNMADVRNIQNELAALVKPPENDSDLSRFYDRLMYTLILKKVELPASGDYIKKHILNISKVANLSKGLLMKSSIPEVKEKLDLIKKPLDQGFWKQEGIAHLEKIRAELRHLIKYIDKEDQRYVTTDFEDELDETKVIVNDFVSETDLIYKSPFKNNVHRLEEIIRENQNNLTISRIRKGEAITKEELTSLESLLLQGGIAKEELEKELQIELNLVSFIIELTGLEKEHVDQAFATFINEYQLNAVQISFLDTIKQFLTKNGKIDPVKLYDSPFKSFHSMGIDGVFNNEQAEKIFRIVEGMNTESKGA
jgi:type I restriction enzyme R subunit